MSFHTRRRDSGPTRICGLWSHPPANAGFTLIESLIAIAVLAVALAAIGTLVGTTVKGIRSVDRRLPLLETAQNLLASLPDRNALPLGTQFGSTGVFRWWIDVVPLPATPAPKASTWMPVAITVRVQGTEGPPLHLDTVRLIPRPAR
jgi:general secretion pathway protein I